MRGFSPRNLKYMRALAAAYPDVDRLSLTPEDLTAHLRPLLSTATPVLSTDEANAIRWQVWTTLLAYGLLRYAAHLSQWGHSFTRLVPVARPVERLPVA